MAEENTQSQLLTAEAILEADDLETRKVEVPEWGGHVIVRALSRRTVLETLDEVTDHENGTVDQAKWTMLLVLRGIHEPRLTEDRFEQLNAKHSAPIKRIAEAVKDVSGLGDRAFLDGIARFQAELADD